MRALLVPLLLLALIPSFAGATVDLGLATAAATADFDDAVLRLVIFQDQLIAGGGFMNAGDEVVNGIAMWNGNRWGPLPTEIPGAVGVDADGVTAWVSALAVWDGKLVVGGRFDRIGGIAANNIATFDGTSWAPLNEGVNNRVASLLDWDGLLIVGGVFITAGNESARRVASWTGENWFPLAEGLLGGVTTLAIFRGDLYAGGGFEETGDGFEAKRVAHWTGNFWEKVGGGVSSGDPVTLVFDMVVYQDRLIVGGSFQTAGGNLARRVASWDGLHWSGMDSGFTANPANNIVVGRLMEYGGRLVAAGNFTLAGGESVPSIAWWKDDRWRPLGEGMNGAVWSLASDGVSLVAGGSFTSAWGQPRVGLAAWDGQLVPVRVSAFTADWIDESARIQWRLGELESCARMELHRGDARPGDGSVTALLASESVEAARSYIDAEAPLEGARYWLRVEDCFGESSWHGPATLTPTTLPLLSISSPVPNPMRDEARIAYAIGQGGEARLTVHDARGRRVRVLATGYHPGGRHALTWDGRDDAGHRLPAGTYHLRLSSGRRIQSSKLLLKR